MKTCEEHVCLKNFLWQKKKVPWKNIHLQLLECNLERSAISEAFLCVILAVIKVWIFFLSQIESIFHIFFNAKPDLIVSAQLKKLMLHKS